jgi:hypothetical protein
VQANRAKIPVAPAQPRFNDKRKTHLIEAAPAKGIVKAA